MRAGAAGLAVRDAVRRGLADLAGPDAAGSMQRGISAGRVCGRGDRAVGAGRVQRWAGLAGPGGRDGVRRPPAGPAGGAVVVDHGLQPGSEAVAAVAAAQCRDLGLDPVEVVRVEVPIGAGDGPEAAARTARYDALARVAGRQEASAVLLGHTLDDQAESVLLGLLRGSGTRALSGMAARRGIYRRPLLGLDRATTTAACAEAGLDPWADPHNSDPAYARARARALLGELEGRLGTGVRVGLARSAELLRADDEALAAWAEQAYVDAQAGPHTSRAATRAASPDTGIEAGTGAGLDCRALAALPAAIRASRPAPGRTGRRRPRGRPDLGPGRRPRRARRGLARSGTGGPAGRRPRGPGLWQAPPRQETRQETRHGTRHGTARTARKATPSRSPEE